MLLNMIFLGKVFLYNIRVREDKGQGLIEYGLIVIFVSIVVILVLQALGVQVFGSYQDISDAFGADF